MRNTISEIVDIWAANNALENTPTQSLTWKAFTTLFIYPSYWQIVVTSKMYQKTHSLKLTKYKRKFKVSRYKSHENKEVAILRQDKLPVSADRVSKECESRTTKLKEISSHMSPSELHHTHWLWSALDINNSVACISIHIEKPWAKFYICIALP